MFRTAALAVAILAAAIGTQGWAAFQRLQAAKAAIAAATSVSAAQAVAF